MASSSRARHLAGHVLRRHFTGLFSPLVSPSLDWDYSAWLEGTITERKSGLPKVPAGLFSILTCVYEGSPADLFERTAQSVFAQDARRFEWVVVVQGKIPAALDRALRSVAGDARVRAVLKPENLGIMRGLRAALEAATGDFVLPLDGDDLLLPDSLSVLAAAIYRCGRPPFLYGDEDAMLGESPASPFFRPDWDPLLNLASSYIWHPSVFDRRMALELGVFTDLASEFCQDWDAVFRFLSAGVEPVHVPEVLYHWTAHEASSTNRARPHSGSLRSQRNILEQMMAARSLEGVFEVGPFPLDRGLPELWPRRVHRDAPQIAILAVGRDPNAVTRTVASAGQQSDFPVRTVVALGPPVLSVGQRHAIAISWATGGRPAPDVVSLSGSGVPAWRRAVQGCQEEWVAVTTPGLVPTRADWLWEAVAMGELIPDVGFVSGRILDHAGLVLGGGELWGACDPVGCPDRGSRADAPGPYAISLKPHSVSAVDPRFFIARASALKDALCALPDEADPRWLGAWLGVWAHRNHIRTAFSPLIAARFERMTGPQRPMPDQERRSLRRHFGGFPARHPLVRLYRPTAE